jgi:predicted N-acetyltransferase YhbS
MSYGAMSLEIRPAAESDAAALAALATDAFRATYGPLADPANVEAVVEHACSEAAFRDLAARASAGRQEQLLVAVDEGEVVAFLDAGEEPEGLELRRLYTKVGGTSRGVGSALLEHFEDGLPAGTRYRIVVLAGNDRGAAFWHRHGFRIVTELDGIGHFATHRGVSFAADARPETLIVMEKAVG